MDRSVEEAYEREMATLTGAERVARSAALFSFAAQMIAHQIRKTAPEIGDQELRIQVARRMYASEPAVMALLDKLTA